MSIATALLGTLLFLKKRSLVGETLSHAAFPGLLIGAFFASSELFIPMTLGAALFSFLGMKWAAWMETKCRVSSDAALTFTLAAFMGLGILLASIIQTVHPLSYRSALLYLYGQAATMTEAQSVLYCVFAMITTLFIVALYRPLKLISFDPEYAEGRKLQHKPIESTLFCLLVAAIVLGIRSIGVMLIVGMLIGPASAARPWAKSLASMLFFSALIGAASAFLGCILSLKMSSPALSLPTGPLILLSAASLCLLSLLIAPRRGLLVRLTRMQLFRYRCKLENSLKALWKHPESQVPPFMRLSLRMRGWISRGGALTPKGSLQAQKIVRLHRLWEVYLVEYLGQNVEKVHQTAEELEHLFSPDLERKLSHLLNYPEHDPHKQPIPPLQEGPP